MGCGRSAVKGSKVQHLDHGLSTVLPELAPDLNKSSDSSSGVRKRASIEDTAHGPRKGLDDALDTSKKGGSLGRGEKFLRQEKKPPRPAVHKRLSTRKSTGGNSDPTAGEGLKPELTEEEQKFLFKVMSKHFLFGALEEREMQVMLDSMEKCVSDAGHVVFNQGDVGDGLFIIMSGIFSVSIDDRVLKQLKQSQSFGELALLYNVKRTATITCTHSGMLWSLGEKQFRESMRRLSNQQSSRVKNFLQSAPVFSGLCAEDRGELAEHTTVQVFHKGEVILREGEVGDWMFVIMDGSVQMVDQHGNVATRHSGYIVGAVGIMCTKRQLFGAKALDPVTCLAVGREALNLLKGPVKDLLRRSAVRSLVLGGFSSSRHGDLEFFGSLSEAQQEDLLDHLEEVVCHEGDELVEAGAPPQYFVVTDGEVAIIQNSTVAQAGGGAFNLKEFAREVLRPGATFGGKSVLDGTPMKESAFALVRTKVFRISADEIAEALGGPIAEVLRRNEIKMVLSDVFLFKSLHEDQIDMTIRALQRQKFAAGEVVVRQGDDARHFFLIQKGTVKVMKDGVKLRTLGRWDYFGERGLLLQEKRSASCEADSSCTCLVLEADKFAEIVGQFRRDLEHRMALQDLDVTMQDLELQAIVGRGTFGIVKLVNHVKDKSKTYGLKCVEKAQVVEQKQERQIVVEREIHAQCYHPCVVQFIKTFQDRTHVYFLTEFLGGGDLFFVIREIGALNKEQSQFYSGSIVLALEYLHGRTIMYRDLKPENVLLDFSGNAKLVDFGCCKKGLRSTTLVGTPEYLAPEVILGKGYTAAVDWWALGAMLHEFVVGPLPFGKETSDQLELFREILELPLIFPPSVTDDAAIALIMGLLERAPEVRVGGQTKGAKEVQEHRYYQAFDWRALLGHYMTPPWAPDVERIKEQWEFGLDTGQRLTQPGDKLVKNGDLDPGTEWSSVF